MQNLIFKYFSVYYPGLWTKGIENQKKKKKKKIAIKTQGLGVPIVAQCVKNMT